MTKYFNSSVKNKADLYYKCLFITTFVRFHKVQECPRPDFYMYCIYNHIYC